jgi:spore germination protein KC
MSRRGRRLRWALAACALSTVLTGCWDNRPVDSRAMVLTMAVAPAGRHLVEAWFRIPTADLLRSFVSGAPVQGPPDYILTGTGETFSEALIQAQAESDRELYLGHVQLLILSARLSPDQLTNLLTTIQRLGPLNKTGYIATTTTAPSKLLQYAIPQTEVPDLFFTTEFSCTDCQAVNLAQPIWQVEIRALMPGGDFWTPVVNLNQVGFYVNRIAVYHAGHLLTILSPAATELLGYAMGRTFKSVLDFRLGHGQLVSLRSLSAVPLYGAHLEGGRLHIDVSLTVRATLDVMPPSMAQQRVLGAMEQATDHYLARHITGVLWRLQRLGADPAQLGYNILWEEPSLRRSWPSVYRHAAIVVHVNTRIQNLGDLT